MYKVQYAAKCNVRVLLNIDIKICSHASKEKLNDVNSAPLAVICIYCCFQVHSA